MAPLCVKRGPFPPVDPVTGTVPVREMGQCPAAAERAYGGTGQTTAGGRSGGCSVGLSVVGGDDGVEQAGEADVEIVEAQRGPAAVAVLALTDDSGLA